LNSSNKLPVIVGAVALGVTGVTWFFLPWLQSGQKRVESQGIVHVERARRLLDRYNGELAYRALVLEQLRDAEVSVDAKEAGEVAEKVGDEYQARHQALWADFPPMDWKDGAGRPAKATYGNLAGQIRDGMTARSALVKENASLLDDAMKEIEEALRIQAGGASGAEYAEALRLKGVALFHRGVAEQVAARVKRDELEPYLDELDDLTNEAERLKSMEGILPESKIDEQIHATRDVLSKAVGRVNAANEEMATIDSKIHDLEKKLASAQARTKAARQELDKIQAAGVDFSDPQGSNKFAQEFVGQYDKYRAALREAQELEAGSLPKAQIDLTGDFLRGKYLEDGGRTLTVQPGLRHYQAEKAALAGKINFEQAGVDAIRSDLARLESGRKPYEAQMAFAAQRLPEIQKLSGEAYEEMSRADSEAEAIEERGLKFLDQSVAASQQAASLADKWVSEGRESSANLAPEAKERSADHSRSDDGWIGGFVGAQVADAKTVKAWIFYDRFGAANRIATVLERLTNQVALREVDVAAQRTKANVAREASTREVELAMAALEKAHKNTERHWTLTAQGAGITYLMVLLGHDDYLADTVEAYRNAIKGRETEPAVERFVSRLRGLEARQP
jgi:hypothetical protein